MTVYPDAALHLRFNEESGEKTTKDSVGGESYPVEYVYNEAQFKSSVGAPRKKGIEGNSLLLDGYSAAVSLPAFSPSASAFTVSVWVAPRVYSTGADGKLGVIVNRQENGKGFELGLSKFGYATFTVCTSEGRVVLSGPKVEKYRWTHLCAVFDGTGGNAHLYVNGRDCSEQRFSAGASMLPADAPLLVGRHNYSSLSTGCYVNTFSGAVDELVIFDRALGGTEVRDLLSQAGGGIPAIPFEELWLDERILADDRFKPQYHIYVPQHWMNEAIAPFYYNGVYHLFFQQTVSGPFWGYSHWGHFTSDDLVHWKNVQPALEPENNGLDNDFCFSGSAALDQNGEPVLFYTGVNMSAAYLNKVTSARAKDLSDPQLLEWNKLGRSIAEQPAGTLPSDFRDPFVYEEDGRYYMLVGTGNTNGNGSIRIFRARDDALTEWEPLGECFTLDRTKYPQVGSCWELPVLAKLKNGSTEKYVLMMSPMSRDGGVTQVYYWLGDFDGESGVFTPEREEPRLLDYGMHIVTCPALTVDPVSGKTLLFTSVGETWDGTYRNLAGYANGAACIRELSLTESGELSAVPYSGMDGLKGTLLADISDATIDEANDILRNVKGDMLCIELEIKKGSADTVGISVRMDEEEREMTSVYYRYSEEALRIDTSTASSSNQSGKGVSGGELKLGGENFKLKLFVDRSLIEGFAGGRSVTGRAYPTLKSANGVRLYTLSGSAQVVSCKVWEMQCISGETIPAYYP